MVKKSTSSFRTLSVELLLKCNLRGKTTKLIWTVLFAIVFNEFYCFLFQINVLASGRIHCTVLEQLNLGYSLLACHWLNARILATVDTQERFHLIDIRSQEELETLDLSCVSLVYNSSHFKGLCTGGNVSKAMVCSQDYLFCHFYTTSLQKILSK